MHLVSVNVATVRTDAWTGRMGKSGIDKRPSAGAIYIGKAGLEGDTIVDLKEHGGCDRAAYAYASEDAAWWADRLRRAVHPGNFGENLTTFDIDVNSSVIGEQWKIGSTILEVTSPRIPCRVFAGFWDVPDLVKQFIQACRPGAYLRVVQEGKVIAGDEIEILGHPAHGVTIRQAAAALTTAPELLPILRDVAELPNELRDLVLRRCK